MKKKILSALLAAAMVLTSCLPVFAEGEVQPQPTPETPAIVNEEPEEYCECGLAKGHEGECQKAAEEFCECGLAKGHEGECQKAAEEFCECGLAKGHEGECQKAAEEFCECGLAKGHEGECQKAAEEFCECGLAKGHEGECQKAAEEFCECGLAKGHEGDCQKATEEFCECGLTKGHEGDCQKAAEEFCECGLAKGHEGDCQKAAEELCECGLAKGHEGECQKAAEEFCECGLAKGHEGDCQKAAEAPVVPVETPVEYCELRSNDELCSVNLTVSGMLPTDVELIAYDMPVAYGTRSAFENPFGDRLCAAMDISLWQGEEEWQPAEGKMVTVCMDAADLGLENGDDFFVYHVHEEDDGSVTEEMLGPFTVENDKAVFEMSRFSTVSVIAGTAHFTKVKSYYAATGEATSGNAYACAVYYDDNDQLHLVLRASKDYSGQGIKSISIDGKTYNSSELAPAYLSGVKKLCFWDGEKDISSELATSILDSKKSSYVIDITLNGNPVPIGTRFQLSVDTGYGVGNDIGNIPVDVILNYEIQKTIYAVNYAVNGALTNESDEEIVSAGDEVIFKIVVSNLGTSNTSIMDAEITDEMPECFDASTVCWSDNPGDGWSDVTPKIEKLEREGTVTYYVKATILSNLKVPVDTTYTNTAELSGGNIGIPAKDTAIIIIEAPKVGSLTITKNVVGNVYDDGDTFLFTVTGPDISMEIVLGAGQSVTIPNLPLGDYTVTENTNWSWRYKEVENTPTVITVNLKANQRNEAVFSNVQNKFYWLSGTSYANNKFVFGQKTEHVETRVESND